MNNISLSLAHNILNKYNYKVNIRFWFYLNNILISILKHTNFKIKSILYPGI